MSNIAASYQNLRSSQKFQKRFSIAWRWVVALILIFFSIFPIEKPGESGSTTKALIPLVLFPGSVRAKTIIAPPYRPSR